MLVDVDWLGVLLSVLVLSGEVLLAVSLEEAVGELGAQLARARVPSRATPTTRRFR
ncbi:hypothetical protein FHU41_002082 [Psychromicrobium silvestre]|uniref:Uncharacterized protein n=1 Tax=Psychromicrobium silvestre TaxID=1645614 RepID=A0A7Y9LUH2_9MICC|nr:hypothetical protein [Psychromicrobium silvestre]NYE95832.1 hypothetical protein [Psychromicrobium silvestre]